MKFKGVTASMDPLPLEMAQGSGLVIGTICTASLTTRT